MNLLAQVVVWLNAVANGLGRLVLLPIGMVPGWLSATLIAVVTGIVLLLVFKFTSDQRRIKRVKDDIKAHLLAMKLFKDSVSVALKALNGVVWGASRLFALALVPMLVMVVPVCLILGQLALWYQARPLKGDEETLLCMKLNGNADASWPDVRLEPSDAIKVLVGPVRVQSKREIYWSIQAHKEKDGYHRLVFQVDGQTMDKELAIGDGFMRVSTERPGSQWSDALLNPEEQPLGSDSPVRSIEIDYPERDSWTSGTGWWMGYWFVVSMIAGLCFRRVFNVNI